MPVLLLYSLKVSVCLGVIYLFYYLALRNLTFYTWNRWYLLVGTGLSFFIPLVKGLPFLENREVSNLKVFYLIPTLENLTSSGSAPTNSNTAATLLYQLLPVVFSLGLAIAGGKLILELISFFRLRKNAVCQRLGNIKIFQVDKHISPFSFGNAIFLNKNLMQPADLQAIIRHEMVHIRQKHILDVLWLEVMCLLNWYNPLVWLLKRAARENLEFLADKAVLSLPESDKKYYQYLLLKVIGLPDFTLANQFNISSLKTRIIMMNKTPSSKRELLKFLFALPLMALLVLACQDKYDDPLADFEKGGSSLTKTQDGKKSEVPPPPPPPEPEMAPPPPPPPPRAIKASPDHQLFMQRNHQVDLLGWQAPNTMVLFLKSGGREEYNLNNKESRTAAEKKYGKLPQAPPPTVK